MTMGTQGVKRLIRRKDGKIIAGVATGLGEYFGVDPVWIRLGFALTTLLGGAGLIAYVILFAILPEDDAKAPSDLERGVERIARSLEGTPGWIGVALILVGALLVVTQLADWSAGIFWGITLIVAGVVLFRRQEEKASTEAPAGTPPVPAGATEVPLVPPPPPLAGAPGLPGDTAVLVAPRREHSRLGWLTIGVLLIAMGAASLLDVANALHITLVQYLALALATLGIGIAVGTWFGRARWLVAPGIALIPFVLVASLIEVPFTGGSGDRLYRPATVAAVEREYNLVAGRMIIDLNDIAPGPQPVALRATAVAGQIVVYVPTGATVEIVARVGAGEVRILDGRNDGVNVDVRRTLGGLPKPGVLAWELELETSLGRVDVRTGRNPEPYS